MSNTSDPMPAATLGMWLFLASESMFFVGLFGSFIVLESAGEQHQVFVQSSRLLSSGIGIASGILLIGSTAALLIERWAAIATAVLFLLLQGLQWSMLLHQNEGPSRNNFFACYFLLSAAHCVHLIAGGIALLCYSGAKLPPAVQIYWYFVNAVGFAGLVAVYFV